MKLKNILSAAFLSAAMLLTGCAGGSETSSNNSSSSSSSSSNSGSSSSATSSTIDINAGNKNNNTAGFSVDGTKLLDANGNEFIMRGIVHAHAWNAGKIDVALDGIAATGANTVRVILSDGEIWSKTPVEDVEKIITACEERNLVAVLVIHDTTNALTYKDEDGNDAHIGDNIKPLDLAANYWIEMKDLLNAHTDTVIINIANEWHNASWTNPQEWAEGYKTIIEKLRKNDIKNTLMIDADGNGQFADCLYGNEKKDIPAYAPEILAADKNANTMFSLHFFNSIGKESEMIKTTLESVIAQNICMVVTEFNAGNNIQSDAVMEHCNNLGVGYIGRVWKDDTGFLKNMDIATDWEGTGFTDWGYSLVFGENGIKETSKICSVYE